MHYEIIVISSKKENEIFSVRFALDNKREKKCAVIFNNFVVFRKIWGLCVRTADRKAFREKEELEQTATYISRTIYPMASGSPITPHFSDVMTLDQALSDKYNCYSYSQMCSASK